MNIFKRALMWTISFYVVNTIAIFYLGQKENFRNFDALLLLLPIFVWACATDIWGKRFKAQKFYKYGIINSTIEGVAFACAVLIYNKTATGVWYYVCMAIFFACVVVSIVLTILIMRCEKSYFETLNKQSNDIK